MAKASSCFATPLSSSVRHLSHLPRSLRPSKASHFSTIRATTLSAIMPDSSCGGHHPSLEVIGGAKNAFLPAFKNLHHPYTPYPFIAWNRHVETIFAAFFRSLPDVRYRRECLRTKDDGAVALDWVAGDISEVVEHVGNRYPRANLYAVGWSIGANILVQYVGQELQPCPLSGAVSLCNPFNLVIADEDFRKGFNIVYDRALATALCKIFKRHALLFEDIGGEFNISLAANAKSVRDFDEGLTRVSFGFKSVDDYYSNSSSSDSIKNVSIPLLCIQADNDPIAPSRGIPRDEIKKNPNCMLIVTPRGGHLGWVAGGEAPFGAPWTDPVVMDFLEHLEQATLPILEDVKIIGKTQEQGLHHIEV